MKTIFWLYPHLSYFNGGSRYIFEVGQRLAKKNKLHLIVSTADEIMINEFQKVGIQVHQIGFYNTSQIVFWLFFPIWLLVEVFNLKQLIKKNQPHKIISTLFPSNLWAALFGKNQLQICWEPFAFFYDQDLIASLPPIKKLATQLLSKIYSPLDKFATFKAEVLLTLNKATAGWIKKTYGRQTDDLTYMGVDFNHFKPSLNKKNDHPTIFHSTDFTALKGTQELIKALPIIKLSVPNFFLLISSPNFDAKEKNKIDELIDKLNLKNNVQFLKTVSYQEIPKYYRRADIVVFTGIGDHGAGAAASLTVLEALACGTPVIRSNYTKEEVAHGKTGYLVDPHNTSLLAKYCTKLLLDQKLNQQMARQARNSIKMKYSWDSTAQTIAKYL